MLYVARTLSEDGGLLGILRVSLPMTGIINALGQIRIGLALGGFLVALMVTLAGVAVFRRVIQPIGALREGALRLTNGETGVRFPLAETREIHDLGVVLNQMADSWTQRLEQERIQRAQMTAILASMSDGVLAVDSDDRIILINAAAGRMLNIKPPEAKDRLFQEVVRNSALDALIHQTRDSSDMKTEEVTIYGPENRRLIGSCSMLMNAKGARIGALLVLNDITRLRRLETIAQDFVGNVSHELKTPVTTILGFIETLLDGVYLEPEKAERFLRITLRQVGRLNAIIEDLLTLSKLDSPDGRAAISMEECDLEAVLKNAIEVSRLRQDSDASRVALECEEGLRARVNTPLLEQALINLIDNALKYSGTDHPIEVHASAEGEGIVISVRDYGSGIDPQHHARVFERFYRVDRNRSRKEGGTGLGLSIVDHIIKVHRGRIELKSGPGKGSEFILHFPRG
jgi:two-component system phosphate regulon sensor histidine kinase PhoR